MRARDEITALHVNAARPVGERPGGCASWPALGGAEAVSGRLIGRGWPQAARPDVCDAQDGARAPSPAMPGRAREAIRRGDVLQGTPGAEEEEPGSVAWEVVMEHWI